MKRGFTLVELLVVIAMIAIISAAMTASVSKARIRSRVALATQETRELTNAILAYENYASDRSLSGQVTGSSWRDCTESALGFVLGNAQGESGSVPVLFHGSVKRGMIRDPWHKPYQYMVEKTGNLGDSMPRPQTAAVLPNYYRLTDKERRGE